MSDWNVAKSAGICSVSGRKLDEGEEYYCALFETKEGFDRRDYAVENWSGPPADAFCYWKSRIATKSQKRRTFVDDDVMVHFFIRLADEKDPVKENFRFVLALILMRRRILKYEQTIRDQGQEFWQMRLVREQSLHRVRNPRLDDRQIAEVSVQLGQILHSDMGEFGNMEKEEGLEEPGEGVLGRSEGEESSVDKGNDHETEAERI